MSMSHISIPGWVPELCSWRPRPTLQAPRRWDQLFQRSLRADVLSPLTLWHSGAPLDVAAGHLSPSQSFNNHANTATSTQHLINDQHQHQHRQQQQQQLWTYHSTYYAVCWVHVVLTVKAQHGIVNSNSNSRICSASLTVSPKVHYIVSMSCDKEKTSDGAWMLLSTTAWVSVLSVGESTHEVQWQRMHGHQFAARFLVGTGHRCWRRAVKSSSYPVLVFKVLRLSRTPG